MVDLEFYALLNNVNYLVMGVFFYNFAFHIHVRVIIFEYRITSFLI